MYVFKGFASHDLFAINEVGVVSAIGEISNQSLTYSREIGYYASDAAPKINLISFLSALDSTQQALDTTLKEHVMLVAKWVYDKTIATSGQVFADEVLNGLLTAFQTDASNFECGEIVAGSGDKYIPEWVSWKHKTFNGGDNFIKVWFADDSFRRKYDEFKIIVVPPMDNLNDFFKTGSEVEALLKARTLPETMEKIQTAKGGYPESVLRAELFDYIDPLNSSRKVPSQWSLLIYGAAGDNIDSVKDALAEYILANSTHTRDEWKVILPDIFRRTEFVICPHWDEYAIPNRTQAVGIYSPIVNLNRAAALLKQVAVGYPSAHIDAHITTLAHQYKSLMMTAVGGIENRDNLYEIDQVFPDFIAVSSTSQDFNRMGIATRAWAELLSQMLIVAEDMTEFSDIPAGMTRMKRTGILYLVKSYQNIHYLVAAKQNISIDE